MNISIVNNKCYGCGACMNVCPVGAISMQVSEDGFLYPKIDKEKCINCGLCARICPALFAAFRPNTFDPVCYAAYSNDSDAMRSSSGGIFGVLATRFLNNGGYVCGAAFDEDWSVKHIIISSVDDLEKLRVSKYVQSDTNNVFSKIKKLLDADKNVLFSGTPCQVAGLYGFLQKDYDKLLTCDVFCHGAPSPIVWQRYLKEIANGRKITAINFRDKENALNNKSCPYNVTFCFDDGTYLTKPYMEYSYMRGFLQNLYLRKSCAVCKFAKTPRCSDISLGDFWGYQRVDKKFDTTHGLSAILVNTEKGEGAFGNIVTKLGFVRKVDLADMLTGNPVLVGPLKQHTNRQSFVAELKLHKESVLDVINRNLEKKDIAVLNFASRGEAVYGACLVGYAMEFVIRSLGYKPSTIEFLPKDELYRNTVKDVFWKFRNRFLNFTGICSDKAALRNYVNNKFDKIIIGSDQILRHPGHSDFVYYLDWVYGNKTLLAYAPSFGTSELGMRRKYKRYAKKCLDRFDALSVREHSGAHIFEKDFGIKNVPVVCDPTMLLTESDYNEIIDFESEQLPTEEYVAYYLLDASVEVLSDLGKKYQLIDAYRDDNGNYRSIGQWLNILKHAKYVVTDSFHGTVFSIIFKRQFVTLTTSCRGNDRIDTLMKLVGENRLFDVGSVIKEAEHFSKKLDYDKIDKRIETARKKGIEFLKKSLEIKPNYKSDIMKRTVFKLFDFIPMFSIKNNKCYICGKLEIGKIKDM